MTKNPTEIVTQERIIKFIMVLRGEKVILDSDLAQLYGVETRRLNEQVRRNPAKFPDDLMFQLTKDKFSNLKSQIATSNPSWVVVENCLWFSPNMVPYRRQMS